MNFRAFCILSSLGFYSGVKGNYDEPSNTCTTQATCAALPRNTAACFELRAMQDARVLCGSEILTYGWDVYNARCAKLLPEYIMQPTTVEDIQAAVSFSHKYNLPVSIRGAGHSHNCNSFKAGSLIIDMRSMGNSVTFEKRDDGAYVHVQPGTELSHVFDFLHDNDLADKYHFTHGSCRSVGVMGYHLHGGMGASTAKWANASIAALDVVTADGSSVTLDKTSTGNKAKLWDAMRVAGSSFGIVTRMTVKLLEGPERKMIRFFVKNSFNDLIDKIPNELEFAWVGLKRWDNAMYTKPNPEMTGSNWIITFDFTDPAAHVNKAKDWLAANDIEAFNLDNKQYPGVPDLPNDSFHSGPAGSWNQHCYPFEDSGDFSRFYPLDDIKDKAKLLNSFFEPCASNCRWNFGPLQGVKEIQPIMTVECNTPETIADLKAFVKKNEDFLEPNKPGSAYANLPLDDSREYCPAYWPQYDKLAAIKEIWDPKDFFNVKNGIHPASHKEWKCE